MVPRRIQGDESLFMIVNSMKMLTIMFFQTTLPVWQTCEKRIEQMTEFTQVYADMQTADPAFTDQKLKLFP